LPVKRNRFIKLVDADKSVNRARKAKARAVARLRGNITDPPERQALARIHEPETAPDVSP
jgi:hypothetical protein